MWAKIYRILLEIRCDDAGIIINYLFIYIYSALEAICLNGS